jgi:hypothetical protein
MVKKCPYCNAGFSLDGIDCDYSFPKFHRTNPMYPRARPDGQKSMGILSHYCPECKQPIMWLYTFEIDTQEDSRTAEEVPLEYELLFPKFPTPRLCDGLPEKYQREYNEAFLTINISPKASAALSRRCLQMVIHNEERISKRNLDEEIKALFALNKIPKYLVDDLDYIRKIGNFAAHPKKSDNTGEIVETEPGEAEWSLRILEELLLFYFESLKKSAERKKDFEEKYGV